MPLQAPLAQFADRIVNNGELRVFIQGLLERGVTMADLLAAAKPEDRGTDDDRTILFWFKRTLQELSDITNLPRREKGTLDP